MHDDYVMLDDDGSYILIGSEWLIVGLISDMVVI